MKAFIQTILVTTALLITGLAGAGVYKYIDENGNVAYGDKPVDGSEQVKIHKDRGGQTEAEGGEESENEPSDVAGSTAEQKNVTYNNLAILTPSPDKVIDERSGSVQIIFLPSPALGSGDELIITVNGKDISKGRDVNVSLANMPRGAHKVNGRILDSNGKTKIQSSTVTFHIDKPIVALGH